MRGIPSLITDIRKKVFAEVTRMAYSGDFGQMEDIPYRSAPFLPLLFRQDGKEGAVGDIGQLQICGNLSVTFGDSSPERGALGVRYSTVNSAYSV